MRRSRFSVAAFLGLGALLVLLVPLQVPVTPVVSDSYMLGFSNHAALLLFLMFALAFAVWVDEFALPTSPEQDGVADAATRKPLWIALALVLAVAGALAALVYRTPGINESGYLLDRLHEMDLGRRPFRDFEFAYGPLMLYLPAGLRAMLHLSTNGGYLLAWILEWLAGVLMLWGAVQAVAADSPRRNRVFLVLFTVSLPVVTSLGENYTALRWFALPGTAVWVWRVWQGDRWRATAAALLGVAGLLALSPELALAFTLATAGFFLLELRNDWRCWPAPAIFCLGAALLVAIAFRAGLFLTMGVFSSGGYNVPLLASPPMLLLLGFVLVAASVAAKALRERRFEGPAPYLVLTTFFCLPAGFGRCDVGHLFQATSGALLVTMTALSFQARAWRWGSRLLLVCLLAPLPISIYQANSFLSLPIARRLANTTPDAPLRRWSVRAMAVVFGEAEAERKITKVVGQLPQLETSSGLGAEQPMYAPFGYSTLLREAPGLHRVETGFYDGVTNLTTAQQVRGKIADIERSAGTPLLLPSSFSCSYGLERRQVFLNTLAVYVPRVRNRVHILEPLCDYLRDHYAVTTERAPVAGMVVARRSDRPR